MTNKPKDFFFGSPEADQRMSKQNGPAWDAILEHVARTREEGSLPSTLGGPWNMLDFGCHTGGMLQKGSDKFAFLGLRELIGIDTLQAAHETVRHNPSLFHIQSDLGAILDQSIDVIVSHEVLYLVNDLAAWTKQIQRVLRPGGAAFVALGSHAENTAWLRWRLKLRDTYGHVSYAHKPIDVLNAGAAAGFSMEVGRLFEHRPPTQRYSPPTDGWGDFQSVEEMLNFYYTWKLLFVFYPRP